MESAALDAGQIMPELRREMALRHPMRHRRETRGLLFGRSADLRQRVDHARGGGSRCADDHEWSESISSVFGHLSFQILHIHLQMAVRRDDTERPPTQAGHVRDFVESVMGLFG